MALQLVDISTMDDSVLNSKESDLDSFFPKNLNEMLDSSKHNHSFASAGDNSQVSQYMGNSKRMPVSKTSYNFFDVESYSSENLESAQFNSISEPTKVSKEFIRVSKERSILQEIVPESFDWFGFLEKYPDAFVVRIKSITSRLEMLELINLLENYSKFEPSILPLDITYRFTEISVSEISPSKFEHRILIVYQEIKDYEAQDFSKLQGLFCPQNPHSYISLEYLDSFLTRRSFIDGKITGECALGFLKESISKKRHSSSLFLKLAAYFPEECLRELESVSYSDQTLPLRLFGERALHKLAVSLVGKMKYQEGSLRKAIEILNLGIQHQSWGYVAFSSLMRLAIEEDENLTKKGSNQFRQSQVEFLLTIVEESNLEFSDKVALLIMVDKPSPEILAFCDKRVVTTLNSINMLCKSRAKLNHPRVQAGLTNVLCLMNQNTPSTNHLMSLILRKCVLHSNFLLGWEIASKVLALSKQVFGEVVTLCSKGYFAALRKANSMEPQDWLQRLEWCVERHLPFLNRYPCGLALHVVAHRKDFKKCWRWYLSMKEKLAFRLNGYHSSAVLKAASFEEPPQVDKIIEIYDQTPANEKSSFTFVPLIRVWENSSDLTRKKYLSFWNEVMIDLKAYLETNFCRSGSSKNSLKEVIISSNDLDDHSGLDLPSFSSESLPDKIFHKLKNMMTKIHEWKKLNASLNEKEIKKTDHGLTFIYDSGNVTNFGSADLKESSAADFMSSTLSSENLGSNCVSLVDQFSHWSRISATQRSLLDNATRPFRSKSDPRRSSTIQSNNLMSPCIDRPISLPIGSERLQMKNLTNTRWIQAKMRPETTKTDFNDDFLNKASVNLKPVRKSITTSLPQYLSTDQEIGALESDESSWQ